MTPYYSDADCVIYHGDAREVMPGLDLAAATVITDPPYGETSLDWDSWPKGWVAAVPDVVNNLWCFGSMRMFLNRRDEFDEWRFGQDVVWEKHNGSGFHSDRFKRVHESAVQWYRGPWVELTCNPVMVNDSVKRTVKRKKGRPVHKRLAQGVLFGGVA